MKRMINLSSLLFALLIPFISNGEIKQIIIKSDVYPITLVLSHYIDPFKQEFVKELIIENPTSYSANLENVDTYMLSQKGDNKFFLFFWDTDITLNIKNKMLHESEILGSPITNEYFEYEVLSERVVLVG